MEEGYRMARRAGPRGGSGAFAWNLAAVASAAGAGSVLAIAWLAGFGCNSGAGHPPELSAADASWFDVTTAPDTWVAPVAPPAVSITLANGSPAAAVSFGDNGFVPCGSAATSVPVSIANTGGQPLMWSAQISAGSMHYSVSPTSGTVAPGETSGFQIVPAPIPSPSAVTPDLYGGIITITTNAPNDTSHVIELHQTARGAIINSTLGTTKDFGGVFVQQTAAYQFSLTNTGNVPAEIEIKTGSPVFGVVAPDEAGSFPIVLGANGTAAPQVTFTPAATQSYTDTLVLSIAADANTPLCGPLPPNVTLTGSGTNTVRISTSTVDFGLTDCKTTAPARSLTITASGQGINYTTALTKGANTPYTISPASGFVAAQGMATITVTAKPIPYPATTTPNGFGDTLTITTDLPGDAAHVVSLNQTARGAVLQFSPLTITTRDSATGHYSFANFTVQNTGNYEGTFALGDGVDGGAGVVTNINAPAGTWSSNLVGGNLLGGSSVMGTLTVKAPPQTTCGGGGPYACGTGTCTARTCPVGANCGTIDDGCGTILTCGPTTCPTADGAPQVCGGGGGPNICGPATCTPSGTCSGKCGGPVSDGCGSTITCPGSCPGTQYLGKITLSIQPNPDNMPTILCADAPPDLLLSDEN
jgi:hypothetical protein